MIKSHRRAVLCAVLAVAVCTVSFSAATSAVAAAGPVAAHLRVETPDETLFNDQITTGPRIGANGVNRTADTNTCSPGYDIAFNPLLIDQSITSPITAAADFADSEGLDFLVKDFGWGHFLCGIGSYVGTNDDFWLVKINNKTKNGADYVTGDTALNPNDEVLFYFTNSSFTHTLDFNLPPTARVGDAVSGTVSKYSNKNDTKTPARNANIDGAGIASTADTNGKVNLHFSQPGTFLISATARGTTRGSDVITIEPALPVAGLTPAQKARQVCAKYRRGWRKYNKRFKSIYRRCVRSVKAKG